MAKSTITGEDLHECTVAIGRLRTMAEKHAVTLGHVGHDAENYAAKAVEPLQDLVETILEATSDDEDEDLPPVTPNSRGTA